MTFWHLVDFEERLEWWIDREDPSTDLRATVTAWIIGRFDDPYMDMTRRSDTAVNYWFGIIPATRHLLPWPRLGFIHSSDARSPTAARMREHRCVKRYVWTRTELHDRGIRASTFAQMLGEGELHRLLPGIYCTRVPTTMDKCKAVSLWRPDAVMSHCTAAWLHGLLGEPSVIEAYVRELPTEPTPPWLHLRVPEYGIYDDTGAFGPDVIEPRSGSLVRNSQT